MERDDAAQPRRNRRAFGLDGPGENGGLGFFWDENWAKEMKFVRGPAAPAPAVEGEPPKKRRTCVCHDDCDAAGSGAIHVADQKPAGEPPHKPTCERVTHPNSLHPCSCVPREPLKAAVAAGEPPEMTFAEAMALPVDEVEFTFKQNNEVGPLADWLQLTDHPGMRIDWLRECGFRRKQPAPVLSRVQEMARASFPDWQELAMQAYAEAIRAVMQEVNCRVEHGASPTQIAAVEELFLGKGR